MKKETQKTKTGHEIPIPKRGDVFKILEKAAHTSKKSTGKRSPKK